MKSSSIQISGQFALAILVAGAFWAATPVSTQAAESTNTVQSVFIKPASPQEGRDPFFPESTRPYGKTSEPTASRVDWTALKFVGISGTPERRLVIINNNTFAEGDEQEVPLAGGRIIVRCLKITPNSVLIMVAGQTRQLDFSPNGQPQ